MKNNLTSNISMLYAVDRKFVFLYTASSKTTSCFLQSTFLSFVGSSKTVMFRVSTVYGIRNSQHQFISVFIVILLYRYTMIKHAIIAFLILTILSCKNNSKDNPENKSDYPFSKIIVSNEVVK